MLVQSYADTKPLISACVNQEGVVAANAFGIMATREAATAKSGRLRFFRLGGYIAFISITGLPSEEEYAHS